MESILLTGGAGFVGSHVASALLDRTAARITLVDAFDDFYDPGIKKENIAPFADSPRLTIVVGDITDRSSMRRLFRRTAFDTVIHLAARPGVRTSFSDPRLYAHVNVRGTQLLLTESVAAGVQQFLFASSSSVYGIRDTIPFSEDDPLGPAASPYAGTKVAAEHACRAAAERSRMSVVCLRLFSVYGPRQRPDLAVSRFVRHMLRNAPVPVYGDGSSARDFTYIEDVVEGFLVALGLKVPGFHLFNLGRGEAVAVRDLVNSLGQLLCVTPRMLHLPIQCGDVPVTCADTTRARTVLGFAPRIDYEEGLRRFIDWVITRSKLDAHLGP